MPSNKPTPPAVTVFKWLRDNLGPRALAPLTSTDTRALQAAVQIVSLWVCSDEDNEEELARAFAAVVMTMQPHCREFAYHAIAHVAEWETRARFWDLARLSRAHLSCPLMRCKHE